MPRRVVSAVLPFVVAAVAFAGCSRIFGGTRTDVTKRSAAMVLLPGAAEVVYYDVRDESGETENESLDYTLRAPFPAESVICSVVAELAAAGWRPTIDDSGTPSRPSSFTHGWRVSSRLDPRSGTRVHLDQWIADFVNGTGDRVMYALIFSYPEAGLVDRENLKVGGLRLPGKTALPHDQLRWRNAATVPAGEGPRVAVDEPASCGESGGK